MGKKARSAGVSQTVNGGVVGGGGTNEGYPRKGDTKVPHGCPIWWRGGPRSGETHSAKGKNKEKKGTKKTVGQLKKDTRQPTDRNSIAKTGTVSGQRGGEFNLLKIGKNQRCCELNPARNKENEKKSDQKKVRGENEDSDELHGRVRKTFRKHMG